MAKLKNMNIEQEHTWQTQCKADEQRFQRFTFRLHLYRTSSIELISA